MLGQKDAYVELNIISKLLNGYVEPGKNWDRIVINYLNLDLILTYLTSFPLKTVKFKSYERWVEIYNYRKSNKNLTQEDLKHLKK
jgi:hypothetical protein